MKFDRIASIWMSFSFMRSLFQFAVSNSQKSHHTARMRSAFLRASLALVCHQNPKTPLKRISQKSIQRFPIGSHMIDALIFCAKEWISLIAQPAPGQIWMTIFFVVDNVSRSFLIHRGAIIWKLFFNISGSISGDIFSTWVFKISEGILRWAGP